METALKHTQKFRWMKINGLMESFQTENTNFLYQHGKSEKIFKHKLLCFVHIFWYKRLSDAKSSSHSSALAVPTREFPFAERYGECGTRIDEQAWIMETMLLNCKNEEIEKLPGHHTRVEVQRMRLVNGNCCFKVIFFQH